MNRSDVIAFVRIAAHNVLVGRLLEEKDERESTKRGRDCVHSQWNSLRCRIGNFCTRHRRKLSTSDCPRKRKCKKKTKSQGFKVVCGRLETLQPIQNYEMEEIIVISNEVIGINRGSYRAGIARNDRGLASTKDVGLCWACPVDATEGKGIR